jgi:uncharacterized protein (DUF305 family)
VTRVGVRFFAMCTGSALMHVLFATSLIAQSPRTGTPAVAAEVRFMQDMIGHHAQAVAMTALVNGRTRSADIRLLAERISVSQESEMALMRRWLARHSPAPPDSLAAIHDHRTPRSDESTHTTMPGMQTHADMPGMLTPAQFRLLRTARGAQFDRRFLDGMIQHHQGALVMCDALRAIPGAAQESELFRFVNDVVSDQQAEIARMRRLRAAF